MLSRLEVRVALLLALAIAIAVWAAHRTPKPPKRDFRSSTLLAGPHGSRAIYDVLVRLGRPVQRRLTPLYNLNADSTRLPAILVELNPLQDLQPAEIEQVVRYVRGGGAVLSAGSGGGVTACAGWSIDPHRWVADSVEVVSAEHAPNLPKIARVLVAHRTEEKRNKGLNGLVKRQVDYVDPCDSLVALRTDTLLKTVKSQPALLRVRYPGGGSITLASDVGWFSNQVWRNTDVPIVVLPLLASPRGEPGRVVLDEYHQGFGEDQQSSLSLTWNWLRSSPVGWALLQILAIALLWLAVHAVRFGPALHVIQRRRRSPLEHLEALGAGLESAGGTDTAVLRVIAGLRRRLSRTGTVLANRTQMQSWLETLEMAMRDARGRAAVKRLRHLMNERDGGDARVMAAAQTVEDVWEQLHPRTTRERF